jgi:DNA-binding transcriptional LysR family regulator
MTQEQLETLEAIVTAGSFKAAATKLHKTQPALSAAIKKLEDEFQLSLFDRSEYRPKLTPQGVVFYEQARESLAAFRRLEKFGRELGIKKQEPKLTIVVDPVAPFEDVSAIFDCCVGPDLVTELVLLTEVMGGGMDRLIQGDAHFAIAPLLAADKRIESLPIGQVNLLPVASKSLLKGKPADLNWLKDHTQIVVVQTEFGGRILRREGAGLLEGGKRCFVTDHALKKKLILDGFGWGRLAENEIAAELKRGSVQRIKHREANVFTLDFHIMRSAQHPLGPLGQKLWNRFKTRRP